MFERAIYTLLSATSAPILWANFPHDMNAGHIEDFQIYIYGVTLTFKLIAGF